MSIADELRKERGLESPETRHQQRLQYWLKEVVDYFKAHPDRNEISYENNCMERAFATELASLLRENGFQAKAYILREDRPRDSYWGIEVKL